jgi:hypothetical protein
LPKYADIQMQFPLPDILILILKLQIWITFNKIYAYMLQIWTTIHISTFNKIHHSHSVPWAVTFWFRYIFT